MTFAIDADWTRDINLNSLSLDWWLCQIDKTNKQTSMNAL